jgi:ubiquinone/menaquinone biosynthesis C-methylase UbiE
MNLSVAIIAVILSAVILIMVMWRIASRRQTLPCPVWLRWLVELDNPFTKINQAAFIVDTLAIENGMIVLDAGCGPGRLTIPIARRVGNSGRVVAMDIQAGMLTRTKTKVDAAGLVNVDYLQAGLGEGNLPNNRFERALLVTVLGEIPDRAAAVTELFHSLKPGGLLAVVELVFDPHFQTRRKATELAVAAGFREKAFFGSRIAYVIHFEKPSGR